MAPTLLRHREYKKEVRQSYISPKEHNDVEVRDKRFEEVVGLDGHGRALSMGIGTRPTPMCLRASSLLDKNLEVEITRIRKEAEV
ncbi:hypothetical protein LguiA_013140 [Lonicera macranthoides]